MLGVGDVFGRTVRTGSIAEAKYGADSAEVIADEGIGDKVLMFVGPWTAEKVRAVGDRCRRRGLRFSMDEMFDRLSGDWKDEYRPIRGEVLKAIEDYRDVFDGTQHQSESGGVLFYWPLTDKPFVRAPLAKNSYSDAFERIGRQLSRDIETAKAGGLVPPYFTIECGAFGVAPYLLRAGWDRVDLEVIYTDELERQYAGVRTAAETYGREGFGTDMAMAWYGGMQDDGLREHRWRTSLYHAYLRGADPIYNEHGLMDWVNHGHDLGRDHPTVVRYRRVFSDFAKWVSAHPRADGYPRAAVGAIYGRCDGYAGVFQTHLFGQRTNELFRVDETDTAWRMFDGLYRRRTWQDRDRWGGADYSGNPPLGAAGILPFDAADAEFAKYRFLFLLGRNVMDDALYARLVRYVKGGGTLMLAASHLDCQDVPKGPFAAYNGGDWSELVGVRTVSGRTTRLPHGIKFVRNPAEGWNFQPLTEFWDPDFTDGGFEMPDLEATTAVPFAVSSTQFVEKDLSALKPVLYVNRVGCGKVIFLSSVDSPGAPGVRRLYSFLLEKAMEAEGRDLWPKVECADTVRWSVYGDGTVYLLNTESHLAQEAVVKRRAYCPSEKVRLAPGEFRILDESKYPKTDLRRELPSVKAYRERLAAEPPRPRATNCTATVKRVGGAPRMAVDGRAVPGTCIVPDPRVPSAEMEFSVRDFAANGVRLAEGLLPSKSVLTMHEWWLDEGVYDFARIDAHFEALFRGMPEGWVFPRLSISPPGWWVRRHPEEMRADEVRPDSAAWRRLYGRMLEDVVTHVERSPYAARVIGYHISALHAGEWLIHPWPADEIPDEAQDPRDPLPPLDANPVRRAYTRKCSGDIASALLDAARTVKRLTGGRKLVGAFFGYLHTNGQQDMARVIASPDVDFFASPASYKFRAAGMAAPLQASLTASFGLHGKVFYEEADIRTLYARTEEPYRMKDMFESLNAIRRSVGFSLAGGRELWWFLLTGNDSFHDERLMEAVRIGCEENGRALEGAPDRYADVGVFFSPDDFTSCSQTPCEPLCRDLRYSLFRTILPFCGVGHDAYLLSDVTHPDLPDYKVYVFPNAFELTEEQRAAIKRLVRRKGKSAIWIMAPGYYRNGTGNAANVTDLTGIGIAENHPVAEGRYSRTFAVTDPAGATKAQDGWKSIYLAKPPQRDELVAALREAGAHFWTEPGDIVAAGRGYLTVCAASDGVKRITLPERSDVTEIYGQVPVRKDVRTFEEQLRLGEVRVYRIGETR